MKARTLLGLSVLVSAPIALAILLNHVAERRSHELRLRSAEIPLPLPEDCRPWRPSPESTEIPESEGPIIEGTKQRQFCSKVPAASPGQDPRYSGTVTCDFYSVLNAGHYVDAALFPFVTATDGSKYRAPCGGSVNCKEPLKADEVRCTVDVTDCNMQRLTVVERVSIACRGDKFCGREQAADCCRIVERKQVHEVERPITKADLDEWKHERCEGMAKRRTLCSRYCTRAEYRSECAYYWNAYDVSCSKYASAKETMP